MEEIVAAAKVANADEFIRELEDGYDAVIGERGATLSGGQRQRIAIARAVIRNAPILVLDEPMTGLDVESEAKVREALDRLMADKTCILITHDLPSVTDADLVLVLEEGRIIECGKHAELVATSSRYRQLYEGRPANPPNPEAPQTRPQQTALPVPNRRKATDDDTNPIHRRNHKRGTTAEKSNDLANWIKHLIQQIDELPRS
jgi:ABC-type protease/lipase transport system fused ATPase/permease subunit